MNHGLATKQRGQEECSVATGSTEVTEISFQQPFSSGSLRKLRDLCGPNPSGLWSQCASFALWLLSKNLCLLSVGRSLRRAPQSRIGALGEVALPSRPGSWSQSARFSWRNLPTLARLLTIFSFLPVPHSTHAATPPPAVALAPSRASRPGLVRVPSIQSGLIFTNLLTPAAAAENQVRLNGSGVAAGDIDGDGRCDLFFAALQGSCRLFRNLGAWRFEDITKSSHLPLSNNLYAAGAALVDVDGDRDLDLLITSVGGGTRLFLNDGEGHFEENPKAGLIAQFGATSLALADVDGDADLDLYVANYRTTTIRSTGFSVLNVGGRRVIRPEDRDRLEYLPDGRILEHGEPDILYLNDGRGLFSPVSWTGGRFLDVSGTPLARPPLDWALSAAFRDLDGDGDPDLYVCGDFQSPDHLWINDGKGVFRALPALSLRNTPTFSMSVDFADLNRDGFDDFLVADMLDPQHSFRMTQSPGAMATTGAFESLLDRPQLGRNVLQLNRGDATFAELAYFAGLEATGWTWSVLFLDVDLDGFEDLITANGHLFDTQDLDANARIDAAGPYRPDQIPGKLLKYPPPQRAESGISQWRRDAVRRSSRWLGSR
jgi:hypothetical protein